MNNIQKSFKSKARCGLRMAVGGVIADPTDQQRTPDSDLDRLTAQSNMSAAMAGLSNTERYQLANPTNAPYKANSMMGGTSAEASMLRQRSGILASLRDRLAEQQQPTLPSLRFADGGIINTLRNRGAVIDAAVDSAGTPAPVAAPVATAPALPSEAADYAAQAAAMEAEQLAAARKATAPPPKKGIMSRLGFAQGGIVKIAGPGTGTSDDIPLTLNTGGEGMNINVSNGEGLAVLPAKTMQHPEAVAAVNDIIETTNGKPPRGLKAGASYAGGAAAEIIQDGVRVPNGRGVDLSRPNWIDPTKQLVPYTPPAPEIIQDGVRIPRAPYRPNFIMEMQGVPAVRPVSAPFAKSRTTDPAFDAEVRARAAANRTRIPTGPTVAQAQPAPAAAQPAPAPAPAAPAAAEQPGAIRRGINKLAAKAGFAPTVPPPAAAPVAPNRPITNLAKRVGQTYAEKGVRGIAADVAHGAENKLNTKTGRYGTALGAALQVGDHFDAFNPDAGWDFERGNNTGLTPVEKGQILLRDAGVLAGGTAGAVGGGTVGSVVPVAGTTVGAVAGGVGGAVAADKGMDRFRRGLNWANEKLGGAPNYWESADDLVQRSREFQKANGQKEGVTQSVARKTNAAIGEALSNVGLISRDTPPKAAAPAKPISADAPLGNTPRAVVPEAPAAAPATPVAASVAMPLDQELQARSEGTQGLSDIAMRGVGVRGGTDAMANARRGLRGIASSSETRANLNDAHAQQGDGISYGVRNGRVQISGTAPTKAQYVGADGKATSNWYDTQDYKDSQTRAAKDKQLLADYERRDIEGDLKSNLPFYQNRGLRRQVAYNQNAELSAKKAALEAESRYRQDALGVQREGNELQKRHYGIQERNQEMAIAAAQIERQRAAAEFDLKAKEAMDKDEEQARKMFAGNFITKDGDGKQVEDKSALDDFLRRANHSILAEGAATKDPRLFDKSGRPRSLANMDKATQDFLLNRYNAYLRWKQAQGWMHGYADKGDTMNLFDLNAREEGDDLVFDRLGKSRAQKKDFMYTTPVGALDLQAIKTPDDTLYRNLIGK